MSLNTGNDWLRCSAALCRDTVLCRASVQHCTVCPYSSVLSARTAQCRVSVQNTCQWFSLL